MKTGDKKRMSQNELDDNDIRLVILRVSQNEFYYDNILLS